MNQELKEGCLATITEYPEESSLVGKRVILMVFVEPEVTKSFTIGGSEYEIKGGEHGQWFVRTPLGERRTFEFVGGVSPQHLQWESDNNPPPGFSAK